MPQGEEGSELPFAVLFIGFVVLDRLEGGECFGDVADVLMLEDEGAWKGDILISDFLSESFLFVATEVRSGVGETLALDPGPCIPLM